METDLQKAMGKKLTAREHIVAPQQEQARSVVQQMERRMEKKYEQLQQQVQNNITRTRDELRRTMDADMERRYDGLKKRIYKNLSVITGSVMRDIVMISRNIKGMWRSAQGWPDGHYCLYKYGGECPGGFLERRSHVHRRSVYCCKKSWSTCRDM